MSHQRQSFEAAKAAADFKMGETLLLLLFNVCVTVGIFFTMKSDQIFGVIGDTVRMAPQWVAKPLVDCVPCMSSVYGTLIFWLFHSGGLIAKLVLWPFYLAALVGMARLINLSLQAIRKEAEEAGDDD